MKSNWKFPYLRGPGLVARVFGDFAKQATVEAGILGRTIIVTKMVGEDRDGVLYRFQPPTPTSPGYWVRLEETSALVRGPRGPYAPRASLAPEQMEAAE